MVHLLRMAAERGLPGVFRWNLTYDPFVSYMASVAPSLTKQVQAGKIIQAIAPIVEGKGGGKNTSKVDAALTKAAEFLNSTAH